ncbi:restriction endonuclease [Aliarcobacter butzleri]|uniref:restriction endonuclease n=1 Tax=Aliarcobacter butzleri TaxID=28197 RepID=UPI002B246066|nr:restriction endonuclease [Aliarcobacter butzleri]
MDMNLLEIGIQEIKDEINHTVLTGSFTKSDGEIIIKNNGLEAREALIRSEKLIQKIHEVTKISLNNELINRDFNEFEIHPPISNSSPELDVWGLLKKKKQDVVVLFQNRQREIINEGPLRNNYDLLGRECTRNSIVVGVRSQLSSIDKNFDTLMERAFAETMNLRLRHPELVMGEVYMIPVREYDERYMKNNQIVFKDKYTNVEKFISIFNGISGRLNHNDIYQSYKYEKSALILVDFSQNPVRIYRNIDELKAEGIVSQNYDEDYNLLAPQNFASGLINSYMERHQG